MRKIDLREKIDPVPLFYRDEEVNFYDSGRPFNPSRENLKLMKVLLLTQGNTLPQVASKFYFKINEGGSGVYDDINHNLEIRVIALSHQTLSSESLVALSPEVLLVDNTIPVEDGRYAGMIRDVKEGVEGFRAPLMLGYSFIRRPVINKHGICEYTGEELLLRAVPKECHAIILADIPEGKSLPHMYYLNEESNFGSPNTAQVFLHRFYSSQNRD